MTEAGAMHEAGYVYSIRAPSTTSHLYILHLSLSLFWNSLMHVDICSHHDPKYS